MSVPLDVVSYGELSHYTNATPYMVEDNRATMNRILVEASLSPIRSQARTKLQNQSKSSVRRLLSKLTRGARTLQGMLRISMRTFSIEHDLLFQKNWLKHLLLAKLKNCCRWPVLLQTPKIAPMSTRQWKTRQFKILRKFISCTLIRRCPSLRKFEFCRYYHVHGAMKR